MSEMTWVDDEESVEEKPPELHHAHLLLLQRHALVAADLEVAREQEPFGDGGV